MNAENNDGPNPAGSRISGRGLGAALVFLGLYLCLLLTSVPRSAYGYTFVHFLLDYKNGVTRRALEGEIARHLFPPPYAGRFFLTLTFVLAALSLALFLIVAALALFRQRSRALLLVIFAAATSPMVFKNYLYDCGRQDVFGLLLAEALMILELLGCAGTAQWLLGLAIIPLCLVADNQLFLFIPICFALTALEWKGEKIAFRKYSWLLLLPVAISLLLSFSLPSPRIPLDEYRQYLQSKSTVSLATSWGAEPWLYSTLKDNLLFAKKEFHRLEPEYARRALDFGFFMGVNALAVFFAASALRKRRALMLRYILITLAVTACYLPLYFLGSDYSRWTSNLTTCAYLVAIYALARFESSPPVGGTVLFGVIVFQAVIYHGFGVVAPIFAEISSLASFYWHALASVRTLML